jgi:hypothetical protein
LALNVHRPEELPAVRTLASNYSRAKQERDQARKQASSFVCGDALKKVLLDAGCQPGFVRAAVATLEPQIKVGEDSQGNLMAAGPGGTPLSDMATNCMETEGEIFKASEAAASEGKRDPASKTPAGSTDNDNPWSAAGPPGSLHALP